MTALAVSSAVEVDVHKRTVVIPKVSLQDFAPGAGARNHRNNSSNHGSSATPLDCLRNLLSYVRRDDKAAILKMLSASTMAEGGNAAGPTAGSPMGVTVRMKNPSLRCRTLQILLSVDEGGSIKPSDNLADTKDVVLPVPTTTVPPCQSDDR